MYQLVHNICLALMGITAVAVFACVFYSIYEEFKETPTEKRSKKLLWYMLAFIVGVVLVFVGQYYIARNDYAQNLKRAWAEFERMDYILPVENGTFGGTPYEIESETEVEK